MARVVNYIQFTIGLPFILSINKSGIIKWSVDESFAVHKNMRSHIGGFMTMVTVWAYIKSSFKKLNIKSSIEAKFVIVDDVLTQVIWNQYFLKEQIQ